MLDLEVIKNDYVEHVNRAVSESLIENGVSEEETEMIMMELKEELKKYNLVVDIPFAVISILQELYDSSEYENIYKEIAARHEKNKQKKKSKQKNEEFCSHLSVSEKRHFTHSILNYMEDKEILPLFIQLWSRYTERNEEDKRGLDK